MPYVIALVIIIVAAGALLLFRQSAEAPAQVAEEPVATEEASPEMTDTEAVIETNLTAPEQATLDAEEAVAKPVEEETLEVSSTSYEATASYLTPKRTEHDIAVTLEIKDNIIVGADVTYDGGEAATPAHSGFDGAYATEVIGADISEVTLSRVGGASLTSDAFNEAVADIRAQI